MDELDKYKKAWENQSNDSNNLSREDIYTMTHAKSSSIVRQIFIIGILEFMFWAILNFIFIGTSYGDFYDELDIKFIFNILITAHYFFIAIFLFLFYKNYKSISISENTKTLIQKILDTRKTVKYYVYFNILYTIISNVILFSFLLSDLESFYSYYNNHNIGVPENKRLFIISTVITIVISLGIAFLFLWLFYKLIYGILLKKLNANYKELIKLEELNNHK